MKCLIVDDDERWRGTLGEELKMLGFECSFATNDKEAIHAIMLAEKSGEPFKLITLDRQMGAMGGIAGTRVLSYLKSRQERVTCVVISGTSDPSDVRDYLLQYGVRDFISKTDKRIWDKLEEIATKLHSNNTQLKILFLAADPSDISRLRLGEEFREIQEKLRLAKDRERFTLEQRTAVRPEDLSQALLDEMPQIVHFSGHGTPAGELCIEDRSGCAHPIQPAALAELFRKFSDTVKCVILNACYSEEQAHAIVEYIPCVIGMNREIGDKAAIAFAIGFYQALGAGRSVEDSYELGCTQIGLQDIPEHLTPVLLKGG